MRRALVPCVAAAFLAAAPAARATNVLVRAVRHLASAPVYVDPKAQEQLTAKQIARIENEIARKRAGPIYIALLPASAADAAGGDPSAALRTIAVDLNRPGTYAAVIGGQVSAGATSGVLPRGKAGKLAAEALDAHRSDGVAAVLVDFVDRVGAARRSGGGTSFPWWPFVLVGAIALLFLLRGRQRRRADGAELVDVRAAARDDLTALAEDVRRLERRVQGHPDAEAAYGRALASCEHASRSFDRARSPEQLVRVAESVADGRYELAVVDALLAGREPPPRTPPCFFDARHGPSSREVEWAPPGGTPRQVPACEADAQRVERGDEPLSRHVLADGALVPYWAAPPAFGGYFGGFLPGLLLGDLLAGGWGFASGAGYYDPGGNGSGTS